MVTTQRSQALLLPVALAVALVVAVLGGCTRLSSQGAGAFTTGVAPARRAGARTSAGAQQLAPAPESGRRGATALGARGGEEDAEAEAIELGSFSAFVVGLALLPYVVNTLVVSWEVGKGDASFELGPFGLELISCVTTVGITLWSISSFIGRGRGLPAGPLGLLGLSEGLSYLGVIGLVIAAFISGTRGGGGPQLPELKAPSLPTISAPSLPGVSVPSVPGIKVPDFKVPDFKAPEIKAPDFKAPSVPSFSAPSLPSIKVPEIPKMPEFKAPEVKVPEVKVPEFKVPEVPALKQDSGAQEKAAKEKKEAEEKKKKAEEEKKKAEEEKKKAEKEKKEAEQKAAEKKAAEAKKSTSEAMPDYDSLFS